jgi:peptidoglycan/xylan/chitin deacetylase (PgdA/CDA1 family)
MNGRRLSLLGVAALVIGGCGSTDNNGGSGSTGTNSGSVTGTTGSSGSGTGGTGSSGTTGSGTGGTGSSGTTGSGTGSFAGSSGTISGTSGSATGTTGTSGTGTGTTGTSTGTSGSSTGTSGTGTGTTGTSGTTTGTTGTSTGTSGTSTGASGTTTPTGDGGVGASGLPAPTVTTPVAKPSGAAGGLSVLNWAGFKAALSLNFDDANSSQISNYAALEALGVPYTFFLWASKISQGPTSAWQKALADGHEMGNHTQDHYSTAAQASQAEVDEADTTIQSDLGVKTYTFASPSGFTTYIPFGSLHHFIVRSASGGLVAANSSETSSGGTPNWEQVPCFIPAMGAPASSFETQIDGARSNSGWQVILVHGFIGGTDGAYQPVNLSDYQTMVMYAKTFPDLWIGTMVNVAAYWRAQSILKTVTPTTSGGVQTYTWTLPANFPPGKYLRVTVTGGTVSQNGEALTWDTHGYYEISLDAGSLTIQ